MEYNIVEFVDLIREYLYGFFPYENDDQAIRKHPKRPLHIRDIAFMWLPTHMGAGGDMITFDIGDDYSEQYYPYYHILQDSPVIHKRGKGTAKSKGTMAEIKNLSQRDYGRINFNGKTFSREYTRNVRGARASVISNSTRYVGGKKINMDSTTYANTHYHYIDKILDYALPFIADYFGMKMGRKIDSGLEEEYNEQYRQDTTNLATGNWDVNILDIMTSHD